jgi:two-component system, LytTR family, sensor kinase
MQHPFLKNIQSISLYIGMWILIAVIHFSILFFLYDQSLIVSATDSIVFNFLYSLLAIAVWYTVRYSQSAKQNSFNFIFSHVISLVIILFLWFGIGTAILHVLFHGYEAYSDFYTTSVPWRIISGSLFYLILVMIYYVIIYYNNLQEKLRNEARLNEVVKDSELNLLKAQINPHFLFNSLNSVSSLIMTNPSKAQEMVIKLSDFLRYTISRDKERFSTLELELENTRRYLDIEQIRFGSKLEYEFNFDDRSLSHEIPVMILQPLFENAVKHGVYESTGKVTIKTRVEPCEDCLEIIISNNFEPGAPQRKGAGIGLKNIRERLKLIYRNEQLLKTRIIDNLFEATLTIPIRRQEARGKRQ